MLKLITLTYLVAKLMIIKMYVSFFDYFILQTQKFEEKNSKWYQNKITIKRFLVLLKCLQGEIVSLLTTLDPESVISVWNPYDKFDIVQQSVEGPLPIPRPSAEGVRGGGANNANRFKEPETSVYNNALNALINYFCRAKQW